MRVRWSYILALIGGFILSIAFFLGALYTQFGIPTETSHYIFDLSQRKEQLAAERPGRRLLIVAGSSALFGINAEVIEQQTGYPTINLGTAVGLSLDYRFYRLEKMLRPGDTVLLACEYESYTNGIDFKTTDDYVLARDPDYVRRMSLLGKIGMATRIPFTRLQKGWRNLRTPEHVIIRAYSPYNPFSASFYPLDANGDETFNEEANRPPRPYPPENFARLVPILVDGMPSGTTKGFEMLTAFIEWAHAHQVTVLATFPNVIYRPAYDGPNGREAIRTITHFYAAQGVPVVGTAREAMLPANQFFDYIYHLTHPAAIQRTERLIPELRPYLQSGK